MQAVRAALSAAHGLTPDVFGKVLPAAQGLSRALEKRRLLSEEMQFGIERCLQLLDRAEANGTEDPVIAIVRQHLRDAEAAGQRVLDLLGAARDVGWHRGTRD